MPDVPLLRRMLRFGLPTMPAELTLYSLNFIDRIIIVRLAGLAEAGLYALAVKFANGLQVLARGFQLAFPPLAYSIRDDDEARGVYALIVTWFAALLAFAVVGLWLEARWIVRLLAADTFFPAYQAIGLLATGIALYALYLAMVVILGRTGRTEYSFPATAAAVVVNIVLNLVLVPSEGIVGAAIALVASYVVVLVLMYLFTQRLFHVPYEWRRLALVVFAAAGLIGLGEAVVPTDGIGRLRRAAGPLAGLPAGPLRACASSATTSASSCAGCCGPRRSAPACSSWAPARAPPTTTSLQATAPPLRRFEQAQRDSDRP